MAVSVRSLYIIVVLAACQLSETNAPPDAGTAVGFRLGLTTRYVDPATALDGLSIWVDGENHVIDGLSQVVSEIYPSAETAVQGSHTVEVRFGQTVLDHLVQRPGAMCASSRGDGNRLVSESVNLCLRSNGEVQVNDFTCEYAVSGFFTADVFCPTDCHPLLGPAVCKDERCGLVLRHKAPRFGVLACVPEGVVTEGAACREPALGEPDACERGLACVRGLCRRFCLGDVDCPGAARCQTALSNDAEPLVCIDPGEAPPPAEAAEIDP